ncbi:binding protein [Arabidopsis lyrata subsp. lyrata]|uniref:Binding protein n=1 Tax=Arabidopsis lyrata subsp. lyrata TaxID=81972 RepID=D7LD65_ARALL|nr:binding protein [Arabidopsis lyrata subsp. lyrata]
MTTPITAKHAPVTGKEEGELSASDDEVQPMQTSTRAPPTEHVSVPSANTNIQRPQAGNGGSLIKPSDATPTRLTHPGGRIFEKKQAIAAIHGKKFPARGNNSNLVINFSDDDSGSESDGNRRTQTSNIQSKGTMSGNRNPSTFSQTKLKGPRQTDNRAITKKPLPTSTFSHAATSKVSNLSSAKEMKANKNIHTSERTVSKDTRLPEQIVNPNNIKLQDLKQQIALRESELKLKAAQPKKDAINPKISPARRVSIISDDTRQLEPNEPAKKRLKVSGIDTSQPVTDYRVPASAAAPMDVPDIRKSLLPGVNANPSCKHLGSNSDEIVPPVVSQHTVEGNTSSSVVQKSAGKANCYEGGRELETMKNSMETIRFFLDPQIMTWRQLSCLNNSGLWNIPGNTTAPGHSQLDMLSLTNLEESLDKELEEAQERKRLCEIEERNALKVYRKAQRSLIEANARCAELYSKREILSAHYGSLLVRDSRLLWPSIHGESPETGFHFLNNSTGNIDLATKTDIAQHTQLESNHRYNSDCGGSQPPPHSRSGQNLGSEPYSDLGASTSDGLPCSNKQTASRLCSPSSDANILPDDESFPVDHESTEGNLGHQTENLDQTLGNQNALLLEASLRSKLFEHLGMRAESKGVTCFNGETVIDRGDERDVASERTQRDDGSPFSEIYQHNDSREPGANKLQGNPSEAPVERRSIEEFQSSVDMESHRSSPENDLLSSVALSGPLFRSTIYHLKVPGSSITSLGPEYTLQNKSYSLYSDKRQCRSLTQTTVYETKIGCYTCNLKVDPSWPLCMYELRGRCNNDECPWQHFKDFSDDSLHQSLHDPPDGRVGSSSHQKKHNSSKGSQILDTVVSPTYLVSLDTMKVDSWSYESVLAQRHGQIWWKHFSACLASSNSLYRNVPAKENEGRIEVLGNSKTYSSYFRIKHSLMALSLLSQCLEGDPTSEILWTVYLLIYHVYEGSDGKDMFSYGVKHSSRSYVIWLMYISSRGQLNDQFFAYDAALSALCNHASGSIDRNHASACILDVLLQMFNLLCISGNVSKAIQRTSKLQAPAAVSDDPDFSLMSHILTCLTYSDKCVFWVCCVYLVIYRKLPDSIVQRLEMEKELLEIEWPSVNLDGDVKQMALRLFDKGMRSVEHCTNGLSENGIQKRPAGLFALNHALFMVAVDELESCRDILKASVKLYPTCLELKLLAVRMQSKELKDMFSSGFEELLKQEAKEASCIQCIWNQYAEYALQGGSYDLARELMSRWYVSVWDVLSHKNKTVLANEEEGDDSLLESALSDLNVASDQVDVMFGYLNLSLHNLLQSNWTGARLAIDQALKATAPEHFMYCLREHAVFQLIDELQATGEFSINLQMRLLNSYLDRASSLPVKEPLSWKFISNSAEKPRVRKLVTNLLAPVSSELLVVNVVLEAWHGPSLVPEKLSKQKELVDFVETILGLVPCNYPLALSVSKLLRKEEKHSDSGSSSGIHFWAGLNLVSTISCAIPVAPEYIWVEAGEIVSNINGFKTRAERFLKKALSVYPMSVKLWRCYRSLCKSIEERRGIEIEEAAIKKGITLD